jgi:DNA modification methylase
MKPYHQTEQITLYEGSCLDVLPTLADDSVDICFTSPLTVLYGFWSTSRFFA